MVTDFRTAFGVKASETPSDQAPARAGRPAVKTDPGPEAAEGVRQRGPVRLDILSRLHDIDLMSDLSIIIEGVPEGAQLSAGRNNWDKTWSLRPIHLANLRFTPPESGEDEYTLTVRVLSIDTDGYGTASTQALFDIAVLTAGGGAEVNIAQILDDLVERVLTIEEDQRFVELEAKWQAAQRRRILEADAKWRAGMEERLTELESRLTGAAGEGGARMLQRLAETEIKRKADLDRRLAEFEIRRLAEEEERLSAAEAKRLAEEEDRLAREQAEHLADVDKRLSEEEPKRLAEVEDRIAEETAERLAEAEKRVALEEAQLLVEAKRRLTEAEASWEVKYQRHIAALESRLATKGKRRQAAEQIRRQAEEDFRGAADEARQEREAQLRKVTQEARVKAESERAQVAEEIKLSTEERLRRGRAEVKVWSEQERRRAAEDFRQRSEDVKRRAAKEAAHRALVDKRRAAEKVMRESQEERCRAEKDGANGAGLGGHGSTSTFAGRADVTARRAAKQAPAASDGTPGAEPVNPKPAGRSARKKGPIKSGARPAATKRDTAIEVERGGNVDEAVRCLKASAKPKKILVVPDDDMAKARAAMRKHRVGGTVKNLAGTKSSRVTKPKKK